jgi:hypothetical protein
VTKDQVLNKLAKWRNVFASWQLGTRSREDGECRAVKDHREVTIMLRAEMNAMLGLLLKKGIITEEGWNASLISEAGQLDRDYEGKFPGFSTSPDSVTMDLHRAAETMRRMGFPP